MVKLRGMGMVVGVVFVMLSEVGCKKEVILDSQKEINTDTVAKVASVVRHVIQVQNPGNDKDIQPNILIAVNKAVDGDTIMLPEGKFAFSGTITTTKLISLMGKGLTKTILYRSESTKDANLSFVAFFNFNINRDVSSNIIISDLCLKSKNPSIVVGDGLSLALDEGIVIDRALDFVITRCRFENFGCAAIGVKHKDQLARGLICNNIFYHNYKGFDAQGFGYGIDVYGTHESWISNPNFGTNNFIFIEDNYFERHRHAIAGDGCCLYVCRYNTFKNNFLGAAVDMHEARGVLDASDYYSARAAEVYNNTLTNDVFIDGVTVRDSSPWYVATTSSGALASGGNALANSAIGIRGGEVLIHDNTISYYKNGICFYAIYHAETGDKNIYPLSTQIGYNSAKSSAINTGIDVLNGNGDAFIWNNTFLNYGPADQPYNALFYNANTSFLQENRDYHFVAKPGYSTYAYPHPLRAKIK